MKDFLAKVEEAQVPLNFNPLTFTYMIALKLTAVLGYVFFYTAGSWDVNIILVFLSWAILETLLLWGLFFILLLGLKNK